MNEYYYRKFRSKKVKFNNFDIPSPNFVNPSVKILLKLIDFKKYYKWKKLNYKYFFNCVYLPYIQIQRCQIH
jgi:hypothetical protein